MLKISSPVHRLYLEGTANGFKYDDIPKQESIKKIAKNRIKTYQTASRMFYWLRAQEAKKEFKLSNIELPKTYLIKLNEKKSNEDNNVIVVQEKLDNGSSLDEDNQYISLGEAKNKIALLLGKKKKGKTLLQLLTIIRYTGFWDTVTRNIIVNKRTGKLALIDLEQPNTLLPEQAWNRLTDKDKKQKKSIPSRYTHNVASSLQSVYSLSKDKRYRKIINTWVEKHSDLKNYWSLQDYLSGKK